MQRNRLIDHLDDNPSLKPLQAVAATGLALATFPEACPWLAEQALDGLYWPEA